MNSKTTLDMICEKLKVTQASGLRRTQREGKRQGCSALRAVCACLGAVLCLAAVNAPAGVEESVTELLPKLAAANVEDRYAPQMELQSLALNAARPGAEAERIALAKLLSAKAGDSAVPQPARVWVVRQLEYIGAAESVPTLARLLAGPDAELKECARRALEKNPAPEAGEALRNALKQGGDTTWKIGLVQSLGERRDAQALELISLERSEIAPTAAEALGKIANPQAVAALWKAYSAGVPGAADALIMAGKRLTATGGTAAAKDIFRGVYLAGPSPAGSAAPAAARSQAPLPVRSAALVGWAGADAGTAAPAIKEALQQPQPELAFAAVTAARVAYGKGGVSAALAPLLPQLPAIAKIYVLRVLDTPEEKAVIAAASDADELVQVAALERLGQIGSAASIPVLFRAANSGPDAARTAAAKSLAEVADPAAGPVITALAAKGGPSARVTAINALAARNDAAAAPALLRYAGEADTQISAAACSALAKVGTDQELDGLIALVLGGKAPCAEAALQAVAGRTHDKSAAAAKVVARTQAAQPGQLPALFDILAMLGGREALVAVSSAAASNNADTRDAAVRALAAWPDFTAAKTLLVVSMDPHATRVQNVLAIQGVARLVKAADKESAGTRVDTATTALKVASRDEEKKLLLSALASVPDKKAAQAIKPYLAQPPFRQDAALAAMNLAEALRKSDRATANELAQSVKDAAISDDLTKRANVILKRN